MTAYLRLTGGPRSIQGPERYTAADQLFSKGGRI